VLFYLSPFPLEDSNGRAAEIRNPFCCNSLVRSQADRARFGQAESSEGRGSRERDQPGGIHSGVHRQEVAERISS